MTAAIGSADRSPALHGTLDNFDERLGTIRQQSRPVVLRGQLAF